MSSNYKSNIDVVKKAIKKAEKEALKEIGELVTGEAKKMAPVDTGNLRDSIVYEVKNNKVQIGISDVIFQNPDKYYARFQEFGTIKMKAANGDRGYLRPAAEENINEVVEITKKNLGDTGK